MIGEDKPSSAKWQVERARERWKEYVKDINAAKLMNQFGLIKWGRSVKPSNSWCYWHHHVEAIEAKNRTIRDLERHISELEACIKQFVEATDDN